MQKSPETRHFGLSRRRFRPVFTLRRPPAVHLHGDPGHWDHAEAAHEASDPEDAHEPRNFLRLYIIFIIFHTYYVTYTYISYMII